MSLYLSTYFNLSKLLRIIFLAFCILFIDQYCYAQEAATEESFVSDTEMDKSIMMKERHSPKRAALLSTAFPGAGQIYNQKYWKLPIVYGGLGGISFWMARSIKDLNGYKTAYRLQVLEIDSFASYKGISNVSELQLKRSQVKRNLDLSIILLSVAYALQIVDAAVDAHLFEYDVNEDITISLKPAFGSTLASSGPNMNTAMGFTFAFKFK